MEKMLFIDDIRECPEGWDVARTFDDVKFWCADNGIPARVSFDHDMGMVYDGYDIAKWMITMNMLPANQCFVHSANPIGAQRIMDLLKDNGYKATRLKWL